MKCKFCDRTFIAAKGGNFLSRKKVAAILRMLRSGKSTRSTSDILQVNKMTVLLIARHYRMVTLHRNGSSLKSQRRVRYERKYYGSHRGRMMNQYRRQQWRVSVRHYAALILARSLEPLSVDELFPRVRKNFHGLKKCALAYMLRVNCEGVFIPILGMYVYRPGCFMLREDEFKKDSPRMLARAAFFKNHGQADAMVEQQRRHRREEIARLENERQVAATVRAIPALRMLNAGANLKVLDGKF